MAFAVRDLLLELQLPEATWEELVLKLEEAGLDQAIDLAMLTDADAVELLGPESELGPGLRRGMELAKPLAKGWAAGINIGLRGEGTPGRTIPAFGRDGLGDGVLAIGQSLPAWCGDGLANPTLEAMGPSPSVGRASRLLTGFTRAVVRGKTLKGRTSVLPPSPPRGVSGKRGRR